MSKLAKALTAAAGNAGEALYVEDVFSTYLYTGTGAAQTITNGIDLDGEGGMVWTKERSPNARNHFIADSERDNFRNYLYSNLTNSESGISASGFDISSVSSTGYTLGANNYTWNNESGSDQVSWTFRKAEKFFDVVTYTGNGVAGRTVAHNLGSTPATIIIKCTTDTQSWVVYHTSLGATKYLTLNTTNASGTTSVTFNDTEPTDSLFSVGTAGSVNASGQTYVAYLFASDAGGFGDDGSENIIKCGSWDATGNNEVNLGFEPQWILIKNADGGNNWGMFDSMRGWTANGNIKTLPPNLSSAESSESGVMKVTSTGFTWIPAVSGNTYIYIAIRRPMKTPESGTEVFTPTFGSGSGFNFTAGFPVDMAIIKDKDNVVTPYASARLNSGTLLSTASTAAEFANAPAVFDSQVGYYESSLGSNYIGWLFKRATGFFDVVAYTGDGAATQDITHNLGVSPDFIVVKQRTNSGTQWPQWASAVPNYSRYMNLTSGGFQTGGQPAYVGQSVSSTTFRVSTDGSANQSNGSGNNYIAYLFATLAGVSKVGSYTGTGSNVDVDCGFSAGARFILIKRTDSTGDWYVYDSVRGIVAGNDPYLLLNSSAAEVTSTDYIDPLSSGFTVTSSAPAALNASGGNYIFLAIA